MLSIGLESLRVSDERLDAMFALTKKEKEALPKSAFGIPRLRKFPLTSKKQVRAAISYFHYAHEDDRPLLARKILAAAKKFGIVVKSKSILSYAEK